MDNTSEPVNLIQELNRIQAEIDRGGYKDRQSLDKAKKRVAAISMALDRYGYFEG